MRFRKATVVIAVAVCGAVLPATAQAQGLAQLLPQLFGDTIILADTGHAAHFRPGPESLETPNQFNQQLLTQLSTFPLGSSSGGFTFQINPALGTVEPRSGSFGPAFAERALTIGKGKLNFGLNYQRASYDNFEGLDLRDGDIRFYVPHIDSGGTGPLDPFFEGDVIEGTLFLKTTTDTWAFFVNYGIGDQVDLAAAIPFVRVSMDAVVDAHILRLATTERPGIHLFDGSDPERSRFARSGEATGIGDVLLRGKWRFAEQPGGGLAAAVDLRLPTGDADNLLGTGAAQVKPYLIGSWAAGRFSPHFNVGYTLSGESDIAEIADEFNYTVGFDYAASPRVTVAADVIGRTLIDAGRLVESDRTFEYQNVFGVRGSSTFRELRREEET